jgi:hypothetical protein
MWKPQGLAMKTLRTLFLLLVVLTAVIYAATAKARSLGPATSAPAANSAMTAEAGPA